LTQQFFSVLRLAKVTAKLNTGCWLTR
jgi:hypothetical protein